jgi:nucleoside-diphosphate-sugar epimerase
MAALQAPVPDLSCGSTDEPINGSTVSLFMKRALITGITGQDGSYLTRLLLAKGYEVHGIIRRASSFNTHRIDDIYQDPHEQKPRLFLHYGDLTEGTSLPNLLTQIEPDEIYHLAAQSHVMVSFQQPEYTGDVVALGTLRLLEAVRNHVERTGKAVRFYQAGSSEMYGAAPPPQNESTPFHPRSPYAASKVAAHWYAVNYREAYVVVALDAPRFGVREIHGLAVARKRDGVGQRYLLDERARGGAVVREDRADGIVEALVTAADHEATVSIAAPVVQASGVDVGLEARQTFGAAGRKLVAKQPALERRQQVARRVERKRAELFR